MDKEEMKKWLFAGHGRKINVVRATQERTGILYSEHQYLKNPKAVLNTFARLFENAGVEYVIAVAVTKKAEPVAVQMIGIGGLDFAYISIPDILRFVLLSNCNDVILVHNHPSGNPMASYEDVRITEKIGKACELMDMKLLDHVIIGEDGTGYSCSEERMIYTEDLKKGA